MLVDIDREKLELAERIATKLNEKTGAEIEISATASRAEALPAADFVVLAVAVDREETWARDHELALRHGISHYAENGGPGAFAHACRNLGLVLPIVRDIEDLCPEAHVLCLTNDQSWPGDHKPARAGLRLRAVVMRPKSRVYRE